MRLSDRLNGSVGDPAKGANNRGSDVTTVRGLLNVQIIKRGSSNALLPLTDRVDSDMVNAIIEFQRCQGLQRDGLIRPNDKTDEALRKFNGPSNMRASSRITSFIKNKEGPGLKLYDDNGDDATIGWGHRVHRGPVGSDPISEKPFVNGITQTQAEQIFREDLRQIAEEPVNRAVRVPLTQNQFDALVSLCFNLGETRFRGCDILKKLNFGDYVGAGQKFINLINAHHRRSPGLVPRRYEEERLFEQR